MAALLGFLIDSVSSPTGLKRWWRPPAVAALGALAAAYLSCLILLGLLRLLSGAEDEPELGSANGGGAVPDLLLQAVLGFFLCQRVGIVLQDEFTRGTVTVAPLGGLLVIGVVLATAGRFVAQPERGMRRRLLAVVRFAVVYGVLSFVASLIARADVDGGQARASVVGALVLPFVWAIVFGFLAAVYVEHGRSWRRLLARLDRRLPGVASGAVAGVVVAAGLGLLAVLIAFVAFAIEGSPDTAEMRPAALALLVLLALPNLITWAVVAGMGATLGFSFTFSAIYESASVGVFGPSGTSSGRLDVPPYWLLLLLIPLGATTCAGYVAARQSRAEPRLALRAALYAGVPFIVVCWVMAWLSSGKVEAGGSVVHVRPSSVATVLLPMIWAAAGTWLGAMLHLARQQRSSTLRTTTGTVSQPSRAPQVFCQRCGHANPDDSSFCEACGSRLKTDA